MNGKAFLCVFIFYDFRFFDLKDNCSIRRYRLIYPTARSAAQWYAWNATIACSVMAQIPQFLVTMVWYNDLDGEAMRFDSSIYHDAIPSRISFAKTPEGVLKTTAKFVANLHPRVDPSHTLLFEVPVRIAVKHHVPANHLCKAQEVFTS